MRNIHRTYEIMVLPYELIFIKKHNSWVFQDVPKGECGVMDIATFKLDDQSSNTITIFENILHYAL